METINKKLRIGQRVLWLETWGQIVTVPAKTYDEYGIKLDSGEIIFALDSELITPEDLERLSTERPVLE